MYRVVVYVRSRTSHVNDFTVNKSASVHNEGEKTLHKKLVTKVAAMALKGLKRRPTGDCPVPDPVEANVRTADSIAARHDPASWAPLPANIPCLMCGTEAELANFADSCCPSRSKRSKAMG